MGMSGMSDVRGSGLSGSFDQNLRSPESPKKETVTASLEEETAIVASVLLMITAAQKRELRALGYTDDQIRNLTPQEARLILADNCINLAALGELITQWKAAFGVGEVRTLNQVIEMAIEAINPKLYAALLAVAPMDDGRTISNVRLARWLRDFNEVVVNGLMLRGGGIDGGSGSPLWSLVPA